ncbi:AcrR family transcriptional regulator [Duganella sp. 3397]|uniref:TetR/AcrR family transcriptional regulator n=1 Tax=Duganella sp. 3397 TaxID=2817732 RepID=UPI0028545205|nr:TetR/AcrR family transcriptional regulator [Duganella sp. 3397]MDR7051076.1 AcrR family transcriptional regulator [Duganella sp. 3397]
MIPTPCPRSSSRTALLDAALQMITESSVNGMTLEGVAARAGVTKGGLIYHFKTKEALLHAVVDRLTDQVDEYCADDQQTDPALALENFLMARIDYAFAIGAQQKALMANLLAAATTFPSLLAPVKRMYERGSGDLAQVAGSAGLALSIWAALDGMVMLEMLNIRQFSETERTQMREAMTSMVRRQFAEAAAK